MWEYRNYSELYHYGVKGMRRGIRRYQNMDGTMTSEGAARYRLRSNYAPYQYGNNPVGYVPVSRVRTPSYRPTGRTRVNGGSGKSIQTNGGAIGFAPVGKEDGYGQRKKKSVRKSAYASKPSKKDVLRGMNAVSRLMLPN